MNVRRTVAIGIVIGLLVVASFLAFGCAKDAEKRVSTTNSGVNVELMFQNDGCKIYRFMDFGEPVYYADCRGAGSTTTSTKWEHMEGKVEHNFQSTTAQ